ncbi:MAG: hypothetical protein QNJ46_11060, partial [Leptolyngbyaceae cyanobacterium MO_188.B28]|nr:hypothetical protein [Leptolyngbyaceae cyanobacterium MO_188.B28]
VAPAFRRYFDLFIQSSINASKTRRELHSSFPSGHYQHAKSPDIALSAMKVTCSFVMTSTAE